MYLQLNPYTLPTITSDHRIIVTGSNGFIGSHLVTRLHELRIPVLEIRNRSDCDMSNLREVKERIGTFKPTALVHLAASPDTGEPIDAYWPAFRNTLVSASNAAAALSSEDECLFVHVGSYKQYGPACLPFDEKSFVYPFTPYGLAKQMAEHWVTMSTSNNIKLVRLRLGSVFGPHQSCHNFVSRVIRAFMDEEVDTIAVADIVFDLIFINDVIDAILSCLNCPNIYGKIINISTGVGRKPEMIIQMIAAIMGKKVDIDRLPRSFHALSSVGNVERARNLLNWIPRTSLDEGLEHTVLHMLASSSH